MSVVAIPVLDAARAKIGIPKVWQAAQALLDAVREQTFSAQAAEPQHLHRVTLFKYVRWMWMLPRKSRRANGRFVFPWSGWLVPVARSGTLTQRTRTVFLAHDDGSCEGVVGETWIRGADWEVKGLPALSAQSSDDEVRAYAELGSVEEEWVRGRLREKRPCARWILGTMVTVGGESWGVIVYDSATDDMPMKHRTPALKSAMLKVFDSLLKGC